MSLSRTVHHPRVNGRVPFGSQVSESKTPTNGSVEKVNQALADLTEKLY